MNRYPGGKNGPGVAQQIISLMPRHERYIEPFLGSGAVLRRKKPALVSIAADLDSAVIALQRREPGVSYQVADAFELLKSLELRQGKDLVYLDPPYHPSTVTRNYYAFGLDDAGHRRLLQLCWLLPCYVMISGYRCELYDYELASWHRHDFHATVRGGDRRRRVESVWCNFEPGASYHDTRFIGSNYRERERIKKRRRRWEDRFAGMSHGERAVIMEALEKVMTRLDTTKPLAERFTEEARR